MKQIIDKVLDLCRREKLVEKGDRVLLSLSAGKDSMALLDMMVRLKDELEIDLAVFHLDHMIRGEESELDAAFVNERARMQDIPCFSEKFDFIRNKNGDMSFEEHARFVRYDMLKRIAEKNGYTRIATAHSMNDHGETLLMRILSGTGIHGLQGIAVRRDMLIRPLINVTSAEMLAYLSDNALAWREDRSNSDTAYLRNHMRTIVLPEIVNRYPAYLESLNNLSIIAREYMDLVDRLIEERYGELIVEKEGGDITLLSHRIHEDRTIFFHTVATLLRRHAGTYTTGGILDEIWKRYNSARSHILLYEKDGFHLRKVPGMKGPCIELRPGRKKDAESSEWSYCIDISEGTSAKITLKEIGMHLRIFFCDFDYFFKNRLDKNHIFVTFEGEKTFIYIRNRRIGDRVRLESGTKKIKDLFIEKKLDNDTKNCVPLLVIGTEIAAVMTGFMPGFTSRVSHSYRIEDNSRKILVICKT